MKKLMMALLFLVYSVTGFAQEDKDFRVLDPAQYEEAVIRDSIQLVDVRTPEEYRVGHLQGAENIDFLAEGFLAEMEKFDKKEPLYIYCRSGNRSAKAAAQLSQLGFRTIIDLKGGYNAWKEFKKK